MGRAVQSTMLGFQVLSNRYQHLYLSLAFHSPHDALRSLICSTVHRSALGNFGTTDLKNLVMQSINPTFSRKCKVWVNVRTHSLSISLPSPKFHKIHLFPCLINTPPPSLYNKHAPPSLYNKHAPSFPV